jgi:hypothetical protein
MVMLYMVESDFEAPNLTLSLRLKGMAKKVYQTDSQNYMV